jgi:hypothetical protein
MPNYQYIASIHESKPVPGETVTMDDEKKSVDDAIDLQTVESHAIGEK